MKKKKITIKPFLLKNSMSKSINKIIDFKAYIL